MRSMRVTHTSDPVLIRVTTCPLKAVLRRTAASD
jgi:hypothetical protein